VDRFHAYIGVDTLVIFITKIVVLSIIFTVKYANTETRHFAAEAAFAILLLY